MMTDVVHLHPDSRMAPFAARPLTEQVVLLCARADMDEPQRTILADATRAFAYNDWRQAIQFADAHGLTSLLWFHLARSGCAPNLPPAVADELKLKYQTRLLTQMRLVAALRDALTSLQAANIPALLFKGPALSLRLYGFLGPRPSSDIDILLPPHVAQATVYRVLAQRYARWEALQARVECTWTLIRRPPYRANFSPRAIWRAAQPDHFAGQPCFRLAPRDELRYLCTHFAMHRCERFIWLADIAELLRNAAVDVTFDWAAFTRETVAARLALPVHQSFTMARDILAAPVPDVVLARLAAAANSPAERAQWDALTESRLSLRKAAKFLSAAGAWRDGIDTARRLIWPDRAYLYDCHDWVPGASVFAARRRRLARMVGRAWRGGHS